MKQKLLVLEANEIPLRVVREFASRNPTSTIAGVLNDHTAIETWAADVAEDDLYPSQTWASLNTGKPYEEHRIRWYNDVKQFSDFFWHQIAAKGRPTVLVGTLHSSPLDQYVDDGNYRLVVPDCFASTDETRPHDFEHFQHFNLAVTGENGRKTSMGRTLASAAVALARYPRPSRWGLTTRSVSDISRLTASALANKERLRCAQFPMMAEIFLAGLRREKPDLGVGFTNHVAANMHRYWYALYPDDFETKAYPEKWVKKYQNEIMRAMALLDSWLEKFKRFAIDNDYLLLLTTSMGQKANAKLDPDYVVENAIDYRLDNPLLLLDRLLEGRDASITHETAMVPQYTFAFPTDEQAEAAALRLREYGCTRSQERHGYYLTDEARVTGPKKLKGLVLGVEVVRNKLTLTASVSSDFEDKVMLGDRSFGPRDLGFVEFEVEDHHSGCHSPAGTLLAINDRTGVFDRWKNGQMDYLDFAPAVLDFAA
ncbi:MAG: hypothetical protein QNJ40_21695 [Xanthomonadales bacterium]|nr:hypothetical protein [Xanthomonadales bacterium]